MSTSLFVRQAVVPRSLQSSRVIGNGSIIRLASTAGPSKAESQPQGSENRGKTTQLALPITAGILAVGAFAWLFTKSDKKDLVPVGVNSDGPDKLKSGSVARAQEQLKK